MHVLIIEDDPDLGPSLLSTLKGAGMSAVWVRSLKNARAHLDYETFDCVLLDLSLPDGNGRHLLQGMRSQNQAVPVIVISAQSSLPDRLAGLDSGADDYLVKPFAMAELLSRLHAVTRRYARQSSERWNLGDLTLAPQSHEAWLLDRPLDLSPREYQLLMELARDPETVVAKTALCQRLSPLGEPMDSTTLEVHLSNLRRKIGPERIRTVRGVGYQLLP